MAPDKRDHEQVGDKAVAERAKDLLVYAPLGLALYMRESGPTLLDMFAARGRAKLEALGMALRTPEPEPVPEPPPAATAPQPSRSGNKPPRQA